MTAHNSGIIYSKSLFLGNWASNRTTYLSGDPLLREGRAALADEGLAAVPGCPPHAGRGTLEYLIQHDRRQTAGPHDGAPVLNVVRLTVGVVGYGGRR